MKKLWEAAPAILICIGFFCIFKGPALLGLAFIAIAVLL